MSSVESCLTEEDRVKIADFIRNHLRWLTNGFACWLLRRQPEKYREYLLDRLRPLPDDLIQALEKVVLDPDNTPHPEQLQQITRGIEAQLEDLLQTPIPLKLIPIEIILESAFL
jgi:hypothetical protein